MSFGSVNFVRCPRDAWNRWSSPRSLPSRRVGGSHSIIEIRNGSGLVLKQHAWGLGYVDELIQVAVNSDPLADDECDALYWAKQQWLPPLNSNPKP